MPRPSSPEVAVMAGRFRHPPITPMIDLTKFKGRTLDDTAMAEISGAVDELKTRAETAEEKARTAQRESIDGRKKLKAERDRAFELLGVSDPSELDSLPDPKGQADAVKQFEAKLKKAERERDEAVTARDQLQGRMTGMRREAEISAAIEGLGFRNPADVRVLLGTRIEAEGEEFRFRTDDGKLVPLKEGAAWFAKTRPDYVQPADAGGQGSGFKGTGGGGAPKNPWAKTSFNLTEQIALTKENPALAAQLKAQAGQPAAT